MNARHRGAESLAPRLSIFDFRRGLLAIAAIAGFFASDDLRSQSFDWGGSLRAYQFFRLESLPEFPDSPRRDTEFGSFRLTFASRLNQHIKFESHAVLEFLSPRAATTTASTVAGRSQNYLPLQHEFTTGDDFLLVGRLDRLNLQFDLDRVRVVVGRQAISWGVTYFWPVMDLFSSFAPQRIDRDYKEGVDAVRVTIATGDYSEVQVIGAVLGPSMKRDGTAAAQARFHLGRLDVGVMGGKFHRDTVAGAFFTADVSGSAIRGELTWTQSGDPFDRLIDRRTFWRASLGVDRQLSPDVGMTLEFHYNGYGVGSASEYLLLAASERVQRGEVNALGTYYTGWALNWQLHPLWTFSQSVLFNWQDPSALWIPSVNWSTSDNTSLVFAAQTGFGDRFGTDLDIRSEYGIVSSTVFVAFKWYF